MVWLEAHDVREARSRSGNDSEHRVRKSARSIALASAESSKLQLKTALVLVITGVILFSAVVAWLNWPQAPGQNGQPVTPEAPKAIILDGLYNKKPNAALTGNLTSLLTNAGYHVDVLRGENVTIPLLTNIKGYKVIILRLHSAIHTDGFLYLFSGELYTESKYAAEQLTGSVRKGLTFDETEPAYFALNAAVLGANSQMGLNGSTIILMGCNGTGDSYSIQRFFDRGAKAYAAWNGYVDLSHSDEAALKLVKALYSERLSLAEAIANVMGEVGPDPYYQSVLEYRLAQT